MSRRWALAPLIVVALLVYSQAVSGSGLLIWLLPAALLGYGLMAAAHVISRTPTARAAAWAALVVVALLWAAIVNVGSGDTEGPVARASLAVTVCCGAMAALVRTSRPASALLPGVLLVCGALALGGAGAPVFVVALVAAACLWLLLRLGPYGSADFRDGRRAGQTAALAGLGIAVAVAVTALTSPVLGEPWMLPGVVLSSDATPTVEPTPTPSVTEATPTPTPTPTPTATAAPDEDLVGDAIVRAFRNVLVPAAITVAVVLTFLGLLALLLALAWRLWVALTWRLTRRRLGRGEPVERVIGAWDWVRLRLGQADIALPPAASPDVIASDAAGSGAPAQTIADLATVAGLAARAGYVERGTVTTQVDVLAADSAWRHARRVERGLRRGRSLRRRWRLTARRPAWRSLAGANREHASRQSDG